MAASAGLIGQQDDLTARIARLLRPLPERRALEEVSGWTMAAWLAVALPCAIGFGLLCGDRLIAPLLALT
jgi:hypothetical protein